MNECILMMKCAAPLGSNFLPKHDPIAIAVPATSSDKRSRQSFEPQIVSQIKKRRNKMKATNNATQSTCSFNPTSVVAKNSTEKAVNSHRQPAQFMFLVALMLITLVSFVMPAAAADHKPVRQSIKLSQLAGSWQATLVIDGGCGLGTKLVTFSLSSSGSGSAVALYHTPGCGNNSESGTMAITSLSADGSGTAQLNFGGAAVFNFYIQVSPSGQVFNMVDITDSNNYEEGSAIRQ
jgi:hypothetical protein